MSRPIDSHEFRRLCGHFATGVTIVTTLDASDAPAGMTANSFASVSLDPPLVSIAVDHAAAIFPAMQHNPRYAIHMLDASQEALSRRFASGLADRFDGIGWHRSDDGHVILDHSLACILCERFQEMTVGDHTIFIGRVLGGSTTPRAHPLLHYRGGYFDATNG